MTPTSSSLGILGGTFDPVHRGHLDVAEAAADQLGLDQVLLIPSATPPHRGAAVASAEDRLAMVKLAVVGRPRLEASDIEVRRGGVSYTVDTLRSLAAAHPGSRLFLLLGADAARELPTWHEPDEVARLATIVIFNRAGAAPAGVIPGTVSIEVPSPEISATSLRKRIDKGQDVGGDLPESVVAYIHQHGLYRASQG